MVRYSIKDLENFTNIKAHTIRIWEQRYKLLNPSRTDTNIRYYSEEDLKKLLNVNLLYNHGVKISRIAKLSREELLEQAKDIMESESGDRFEIVDEFIRYIPELNENEIRTRLRDLSNEHGVEKMYTEIMIPLLERIGELWQLGTVSVSEEHFFSNLLREFFINEISALPSSPNPKAKIVLFLHERERHELSLLFYYYFLKKKNHECYYLGQQVPMKDLESFVKHMQPDFLVTSMISSLSTDEFSNFFREISAFYPLKKVLAGGYQTINHLPCLSPDVQQIQRVEDLPS